LAGNPPGSLEWTAVSDGGSATRRSAAGSTLTLDAVQLTDSGNYTCIATNIYGSEASDATKLIVNGTHLLLSSLSTPLCLYGVLLLSVAVSTIERQCSREQRRGPQASGGPKQPMRYCLVRWYKGVWRPPLRPLPMGSH